MRGFRLGIGQAKGGHQSLEAFGITGECRNAFGDPVGRANPRRQPTIGLVGVHIGNAAAHITAGDIQGCPPQAQCHVELIANSDLILDVDRRAVHGVDLSVAQRGRRSEFRICAWLCVVDNADIAKPKSCGVIGLVIVRANQDLVGHRTIPGLPQKAGGDEGLPHLGRQGGRGEGIGRSGDRRPGEGKG